jgi:hypothetical protein
MCNPVVWKSTKRRSQLLLQFQISARTPRFLAQNLRGFHQPVQENSDINTLAPYILIPNQESLCSLRLMLCYLRY